MEPTLTRTDLSADKLREMAGMASSFLERRKLLVIARIAEGESYKDAANAVNANQDKAFLWLNAYNKDGPEGLSLSSA